MSEGARDDEVAAAWTGEEGGLTSVLKNAHFSLCHQWNQTLGNIPAEADAITKLMLARKGSGLAHRYCLTTAHEGCLAYPQPSGPHFRYQHY